MKRMLSMNLVGASYGFVHMAVELACFYFIFSRFSSSPLWWGIALIYDALAFLPQSIMGIIKDKNPSFKMGIIGALLIILSLFLPFDSIAIVTIAIGNAFIHIEGACETLWGANGKLTPSGIFVGGGSFGVVLGQLLGISSFKYAVVIAALGMVISLFLIIFTPFLKERISNAEGFDDASDISITLLVVLIIIIVAMRSYIGYAIPTGWNKSNWQTVFLFFAMGIGKAMGGILSDYFGVRKTALLSLLIALPFLSLGNSLMMVSLIGVALFSMTMPVTLSILVSRFPKSPGLSFGITTLGLFLGSLPSFFVQPETLIENIITVVILTIVAIICLNFTLKGRKENVKVHNS